MTTQTQQQKEEWRPVVGFEGLYEVSNLGKVRSLDRRIKCKYFQNIKGKVLKPQLDKQTGYLVIYLWREGLISRFTIHSLVAKMFLKKPAARDEVNHKNGKKTDNKISNLEWTTRSKNMIHAHAIGLAPTGERHGGAKLKNNDISKIRFLSSVMTQDAIAKNFGVSQSIISGIISGKRWKII